MKGSFPNINNMIIFIEKKHKEIKFWIVLRCRGDIQQKVLELIHK